MPSIGASNRKYIEAVNPEGSNKPSLNLIPAQVAIDHVRNLGYMGAIKVAAELMPYTLKYPTSIFEGLRPPDDKYSGKSPGWLCYCSRPTCDYAGSGEPCNAEPHKVFLVFVNEDQLIYNWRWENADIAALCNKEYLPKDYVTRFRKRCL